MPRVTILLPCRNEAGYVQAAITSIRDQTFTGYEVMAVDDGSTDGSGEILHDWASRDSRVRLLRTGGRGLVAALASGLAAARGEIVARMDADDIAEPDRLRTQIDLMDADPRIAACGTGVRYFPRDQVEGGALRYERWINDLVTPEQIARDMFVECPIPHPTLMIRRHILLGVGGYRELGWPEDYDLVLRVWAAGYRMAKVPGVLLNWRERPDRASRTEERYSAAQFRRIKVHYLQRTLLAGGRHAVVWGAGRVGKAFASDLAAAGTPIDAFVDVDPRKIGQQVHDAPVVPPEDLGRLLKPTSPLVLAAVGSDGAREEIRAECTRQGLVELQDFVAVA